MRHQPIRATVTLTAIIVALTSTALAQTPGARIRPFASGPAPSSLWVAPQQRPARPHTIVADSADGPDRTLLGLVVGAGLGFVAGWALYNTICEAVDNRCSDSRLPHVVFGAAIGAGLGALVGSTMD
jgi:hypothetical protein